MTTHAIIIFDGVCKFCSRLVQFLIKRDPDGYFRFAAMQSESGKKWIRTCGMEPESAETLVLIEKSACLHKSDALIGIAARLTGFRPAAIFLKLIPRPMRNAAYRIVARNRYRWFGRSSACRLPTKDILNRFIN